MTKPLKLGLAGIGTVGVGVVRMLQAHGAALSARAGRPIELSAVCARRPLRDRGVDLSAYRWFEDARELAVDPEIDVFVELIGGDEGIAREAIEAALRAGKHVVTANKALLAHHGTALAALAERRGVALNFEAAVAGGIPIVKVMRESVVGNEISRVYGILNGTCNYILTVMQEEGRPFADVLAEAQANGYAEADPTFDVGGFDTAHKLSLLTSLAFGAKVSFDSVYVEGIQSIAPADIRAASDLGYRIKLLGVALKTESGIEQRVHPTMVPEHSALAEVNGVSNCVSIEGDFVGDIMLVGPGAGEKPTASSVVSDIADIARGLVMPPFVRPARELKPYKRAQMRAHEGGYYIRLSVFDRPGAIAAIAGRMAEQSISLASIVQRPEDEADGGPRRPRPLTGQRVKLILITHETLEASIRRALGAIEKDGHVAETPQMIRIEKL
jgi:homoserine dehydrogenase